MRSLVSPRSNGEGLPNKESSGSSSEVDGGGANRISPSPTDCKDSFFLEKTPRPLNILTFSFFLRSILKRGTPATGNPSNLPFHFSIFFVTAMLKHIAYLICLPGLFPGPLPVHSFCPRIKCSARHRGSTSLELRVWSPAAEKCSTSSAPSTPTERPLGGEYSSQLINLNVPANYLGIGWQPAQAQAPNKQTIHSVDDNG